MLQVVFLWHQKPVPAHEYGPFLTKMGFGVINTTNFRLGDIAVFEGPPGSYSDPNTGIPYGHIQMFDGSQWISDFKENGFYPGGSYQDNNVNPVVRSLPLFECLRLRTAMLVVYNYSIFAK